MSDWLLPAAGAVALAALVALGLIGGRLIQTLTDSGHRHDPLVAFARGRKREGRIVGKYAGRRVEAWLEPGDPAADKPNLFFVEMDGGGRGRSWSYRGGGAWVRPRDHRVDPTLTGDEAIRKELDAAGLRGLLASVDLYRPELTFDGERGRLLYRQEVPGEPKLPQSDTFAQILSVLRQVAAANRAAQRRARRAQAARG